MIGFYKSGDGDNHYLILCEYNEETDKGVGYSFHTNSEMGQVFKVDFIKRCVDKFSQRDWVKVDELEVIKALKEIVGTLELKIKQDTIVKNEILDIIAGRFGGYFRNGSMMNEKRLFNPRAMFENNFDGYPFNKEDHEFLK